MLAKSWTTLSLSLSTCVVSILLASCSQIPIHDDEWCIDLDPDGAQCSTTVSQKRRTIPQEEWVKMRPGRVSGLPIAFAHLEEAIRKACIVAEDTKHKCTDVEKQEIEKKVMAFSSWRQSIVDDRQDRRKRRRK